jgi:pyruvate-formate lyase-activating enzyme
MPTPSTNGRTPRGQFAKGNPGGPGNPHAKRVAEFREAIMDAVSTADLKAVAKALVRRAKEGDIAAARELFDRVLGKSPPIEIEVPAPPPEISPEFQERVRAILERRGLLAD